MDEVLLDMQNVLDFNSREKKLAIESLLSVEGHVVLVLARESCACPSEGERRLRPLPVLQRARRRGGGVAQVLGYPVVK
jgi:hypothetical protein